MGTPGYLYSHPSSDFLHIDDLLDFSNEEIFGTLADTETSSTVAKTDCTKNRAFAGENPHRKLMDGQDPLELCVPSDDLAELEWLSNFVEDSFSAAGFTFPSGVNDSTGHTNFWLETSVPGRARSKRSRAAAHNWTSRIMNQSPSSSTDSELPVTVMPESGKASSSAKTGKKKEVSGGSVSDQLPGRKCTHCSTEKTPQWRTGPMGPKTLCNACGVRYKSGRLVPEYRPAASPTFVLTQHSNSHRKVMELRRQKEIRQQNREFFLHDHHQDFKVY